MNTGSDPKGIQNIGHNACSGAGSKGDYTMTWQQQFMALRALGGMDTRIHARSENDWYVLIPGVEIGGNGMLMRVGKSGATPEDAIKQTWQQVLGLSGDKYLVIDTMRDTRRHVKWNGFMWEDLYVEKTV